MEQNEKEERIELLEQAQEKLREAIDLIREAVADTNQESSAEAYIIGHLENWAEGNNQYDTTAIPYLIESLEEEDECEECGFPQSECKCDEDEDEDN